MYTEQDIRILFEEISWELPILVGVEKTSEIEDEYYALMEQPWSEKTAEAVLELLAAEEILREWATDFFQKYRIETGMKFKNIVEKKKGYYAVTVYYGTDRERTGSDKPAKAYSGKYGSLRYGVATVSVPEDREVGQLETRDVWKKMLFGENPSEDIMVLDFSEMRVNEFNDNIRERLADSDEDDMLLFVHGYKVDFELALRRTAQLARDLQFKGVPACYSWPSMGKVSKYFADEVSIERTILNLEEYLRNLVENTGIKNLYIISHSMGTRAVARVLQQLIDLKPGAATIKDVIYAAPDIDAQTFKNYATKFKKELGRVTLYTSSEDKALKASHAIHGYRRAGDAGDEVVIVEGVETIDASKVSSDFLSHSYFAGNPTLIWDLDAIIQFGRAPGERCWLRSKKQAEGTCWYFVPGT